MNENRDCFKNKECEKKGDMKPQAKLYLKKDEMQGVFGDGKWELLKAIQQCGSIQQAAEMLGRGYRKAWEDIKRAEKGFGKQLVIKKRGGCDGGATSLTPFGAHLITKWDQYRTKVAQSLSLHYKTILQEIVEMDEKG